MQIHFLLFALTTLNVLANDTDPDTGDTMTIPRSPAYSTGSGTLAISSDSKSVTYTPPSSTFEGTFSPSVTPSRIPLD
ncbi:MAG: Ig-like domain-containing protein [Pirellulales bacterium]